MKKISIFFSLLVAVTTVVSCNKEANKPQDEVKETYATGKVTVLVEESVVPIFEDIATVFKSVKAC